MISAGRGRNQKTAKSIARDKARAAGEKHFIAICRKHGETSHYSHGGHCVECNNAARKKAVINSVKTKKKTQAELEKCTYINGWAI